MWRILLCAVGSDLLALGGVARIGAGGNLRDAAVLMLDGVSIVHLRIALGESDDTRRMEVAKWSDQIIIGNPCWMVRPSGSLRVHGISSGHEQQECNYTGRPDSQTMCARGGGGEFVFSFIVNLFPFVNGIDMKNMFLRLAGNIPSDAKPHKTVGIALNSGAATAFEVRLG